VITFLMVLAAVFAAVVAAAEAYQAISVRRERAARARARAALRHPSWLPINIPPQRGQHTQGDQ
jgi:hypothetical protein